MNLLKSNLGLLNGIKNLIKWFPIIWKDRDYDFVFIYRIFKFKIKKQAKFLKGNSIFVSSKRSHEKMLLVHKLVEIQEYETYSDECLDYFESEYIFSDYIGGKANMGKKLTTKIIEDNLDEYFKKYPGQYKKIINDNNFSLSNNDTCDSETRVSIAIKIGIENQRRSKELMYKLLSENLESWWV